MQLNEFEKLSDYVADVFKFDLEREFDRITYSIQSAYPENPQFILLAEQIYLILSEKDKDRINAAYKLKSPFGEDIRLGVMKLFEEIFKYYSKTFSSYRLGFTKQELKLLRVHLKKCQTKLYKLTIPDIRLNILNLSLFIGKLSEVKNIQYKGLEKFNYMRISEDLSKIDKLLIQATESDLSISKSFEQQKGQNTCALFYLRGFLGNKKLQATFKKCEESLFILQRLMSFVSSSKPEGKVALVKELLLVDAICRFYYDLEITIPSKVVDITASLFPDLDIDECYKIVGRYNKRLLRK